MKFKIGDKVIRTAYPQGPVELGQKGEVIYSFIDPDTGVDKIVFKYVKRGNERASLCTSEHFKKYENTTNKIRVDVSSLYGRIGVTNEYTARDIANTLTMFGEFAIADKVSTLDRYIINERATILFWKDGDKTIVKRAKDEKYDKRLGFLYGYFQKTSGLTRTKANKFISELKEGDKK